ncbi:MAG: hypothetical protein HFJ58_06280 [Clostridia bacterium]|nr:hypothetical protein [Clostridia bacterium]
MFIILIVLIAALAEYNQISTDTAIISITILLAAMIIHDKLCDILRYLQWLLNK